MLVRTWRGRWSGSFLLCLQSFEANNAFKDLEREVGFTLSPPSVANYTFEDLEWEVGWVCFTLSSSSEAIDTWEREVGLVFLEDNCEGLEFGGRDSSLSTLFGPSKNLGICGGLPENEENIQWL